MEEVSANSIERLTDDMMQVAMMDVGQTDTIVETGKRCIKALSTLSEAAAENIIEDPSEDTLAAALIVAVVIGWKAREALMESEELERMAATQ